MSSRDEPALRTPGSHFALHALWYRSRPARMIRRGRRRRAADTFVVSFPKAGRTWLRMLMGGALTRHFGLVGGQDLKLYHMADLNPEIPRIRFGHDDRPHWKTPAQLVASKSEYRDCRVILLVRDLRDLVVSAYFQASRREKAYDGDIESFVHSPAGSVASMIRFYNNWAADRDVPRQLMLLRYEDLHADTEGQLRRVLDFIGVPGITDEVIAEAVEAARFDQMRALEKQDAFGSAKMRAANPDDPESFKTRRGKVGGFVDYLGESEIRFIDEAVKSELSDFYGY